MIKEIRIENYRSIRNLRFRLKQLNVIHGANGTGKSNLYRGLELVSACARGRLAQHLAYEGGMPSALWAGPRKTGPVRMLLGFASEAFSYEIQLGLIPSTREDQSLFKLEPQVKQEEVWYGLHKRPSTTLLHRENRTCWVRDSEMVKQECDIALNPRESILAQIREPQTYPDLAAIAGAVSRWRFYDQFDVSRTSPIRQPQVGFYTPIMSDTGTDLAAALQTIIEAGRSKELSHLIHEAFGGSISIESIDGYFSLCFEAPSLHRDLKACEFSDGTLRYLCLAAALLSKEPADFLVLNEPENSLHSHLLKPLADLIMVAAKETQIWVITHSDELAGSLSAFPDSKTMHLVLEDGETQIEGQGLILEDD